MRILIFCTANLSAASGSNIRATLIADGLNKAGAEVGIVAAGYPGRFDLKQIPFYRFSANDPGLLREAVNDFKPDLIFGITEGFANLVAKAAHEVHCLYAFDIHGIGVVEILELGAGYGPRLRRIRQSMTWLYNLRLANVITVANPTLVPILKRIYKQVIGIVGMTDLSLFSPQGPKIALGKSPDKIQVLYSGNFHKWQGLKMLFDAIQQLPGGHPFEFTILGSVGKDVFQAKLKQEIPAYVNLLDPVEYQLVSAFYRGADVLVVPRPWMMSTYLAFPQKMGDYMAVGRAILATDIAPHRWALREPECGLLCSPKPEGIVEGLLRTMDPEIRKHLSENARIKAVDQFDHLIQSKKMLNIFENL